MVFTPKIKSTDPSKDSGATSRFCAMSPTSVSFFATQNRTLSAIFGLSASSGFQLGGFDQRSGEISAIRELNRRAAPLQHR